MAAHKELVPARHSTGDTHKHDPTALQVTNIRPATGWAPLDLAELWPYHELLYFMVWRDIKVRYKQTALGAAWAIIQPFLTMVVFSIFFSRFAADASAGVPYPLFTYTALVPWMYFANSLTQASNSLVQNERMLTKVYFPRILVPTAAIVAGLLDYVIAFVVLFGMLLYYRFVPTAAMLTLPLFTLLAAATALSVGLWLSALNTQYRDVRYVIPFLVQLWLFATPVAYSSTLVPERWRVIYGLNPMAGVIEGFRWALLGQGPAPTYMLAVSTLTVVALLISGLYYFRRMERTFADVV